MGTYMYVTFYDADAVDAAGLKKYLDKCLCVQQETMLGKRLYATYGCDHMWDSDNIEDYLETDEQVKALEACVVSDMSFRL